MTRFPRPLSLGDGDGVEAQQMARSFDHTSLGGMDRQFPLTAWTQMLENRQQEEILGELCRRYWKPIYSYLRALGFANEQAKDLTQGFFTDKVLGQDLIGKADRTKGRFRNFLLRSVRNYAISVQRTAKAHRPLDDDRQDCRSAASPEAEFNRAWADGLLQEVLTNLECECLQRGKDTHWQVFHDWLLDPQVGQSRSMTDLCQQYGISEPSKAYHMIENVKRRFRTLLHNHLGQVVIDDTDVEAEIREFIDIFSRGSARS